MQHEISKTKGVFRLFWFGHRAKGSEFQHGTLKTATIWQKRVFMQIFQDIVYCTM